MFSHLLMVGLTPISTGLTQASGGLNPRTPYESGWLAGPDFPWSHPISSDLIRSHQIPSDLISYPIRDGWDSPWQRWGMPCPISCNLIESRENPCLESKPTEIAIACFADQMPRSTETTERDRCTPVSLW